MFLRRVIVLLVLVVGGWLLFSFIKGPKWEDSRTRKERARERLFGSKKEA